MCLPLYCENCHEPTVSGGSSEGPRDASAPIDELLQDADELTGSEVLDDVDGTAAMVRSLASALREARTDLAKAILASNANFNASQRLGAELREAREQLALVQAQLGDALADREFAKKQIEASRERFETARRAVEQLPSIAVVKLPSSPHRRDALDRNRVLEILSSPPQQSVSTDKP